MRTLILMRGSPGCGKTTWIRELGLSMYALSADAIRTMYASPVLTPDGSTAISQRNDKVVWETLFSMLERRMQRGDFTIIDACNSKTSEMARYRDMADQYRYRIYCVDMTDVPMEEAMRRNKQRDALKFVPEEYIERVYSRFETQKIPSGIKRITRDQFRSVFLTPYDLSKYKRVVHIGDIHGCYSTLQKIFGENPAAGIDPETAYIFCGDYGDRGADTPKVLAFLSEIAQLDNVCLLEGNHESHLWEWANGRPSRSKEFNERTALQLESAGVSAPEIRKLYRSFRQCSLYEWHGYTVVCTHGGLSNYAPLGCIDLVPSCQMIGGVGAYEEMNAAAASFEQHPDEMYQVYGHRNTLGSPTQVEPHSFCLEGGVEHGGSLRTVVLSDEGWQVVEYASDAQPAVAEDKEVRSIPSQEHGLIGDLVARMRQSPLIQEKQFGHISSFNFTRSAFMDKKWNTLTVRARGLYIDTTNMKVVARGYEKFFAVGERQETKLAALQRKLSFPVEIYRKENGFLGLVSYDIATDSLFATTKSSPDGDMAVLFRSMISDDLRMKLTAYLKEHDVTLLFEAVHPQLDPHIIEYRQPELFLLDAVDNKLCFEALPYAQLVEVAASLGLSCKKLERTIENWNDFVAFYQSAISPLQGSGTESNQLEGYVARDSSGLMLKMKTDYYTVWKFLRGVADAVKSRGTYLHTGNLRTPLMNYFYAFARKYYEASNPPADIITLRKLFLTEVDKDGWPE